MDSEPSQTPLSGGCRLGAHGRLAVRVLAITILVASVVLPVSASAAPQEVTISPKLVAGGKVFLKNDLQAWADAMLLFRRFRREFERIERFEEVDSQEEADLVVILSADPNVIGQNDIVNRGVPYPSGFGTSKVMFLVVFTSEGNQLLWFDAEDWDTRGNVTQVDSHEKLVRRLKAALDGAG